MEVLRTFNNNVILARSPQGQDVVLTGRGLGFQAKPGQKVDESKIVQVFAPVDGRDPDHLGQLVAAVPPEHMKLSVEAFAAAGLSRLIDSSPSLVVTVADHISFAIRRIRDGIQVTYPLEAEVAHLYPKELEQARHVLTALNRAAEVELPDGEVVAIAMHIVNAGFTSGDLSYTYTMTGLLHQLLEVVGDTYGCTLETSSISVARFIHIFAISSCASPQGSSSRTTPRPWPQRSWTVILRRTAAQNGWRLCSSCVWTPPSLQTKSPTSPSISPV